MPVKRGYEEVGVFMIYHTEHNHTLQGQFANCPYYLRPSRQSDVSFFIRRAIREPILGGYESAREKPECECVKGTNYRLWNEE
jgi:hypothetical protein